MVWFSFGQHTLKKLSKGALWGINWRQLPLPLDNLLHLSSGKISTFQTFVFTKHFWWIFFYRYRFGRWCSRPASSPWWRSDRWRRIEEDLWQSSGRSWSQRGRQFGVPFWENSCSNEDARNLNNALGKGCKWPAKEERVCGGEEDDHNGQVVLSRVMVGEMEYLRNTLELFILKENREKKIKDLIPLQHEGTEFAGLARWEPGVKSCILSGNVISTHCTMRVKMMMIIGDDDDDDDDDWRGRWWLVMVMTKQMLMMSAPGSRPLGRVSWEKQMSNEKFQK